MKETWMLYDYMRRLWWWMLLGSALGAAFGLGYYSIQDHPVVYMLSATLAAQDLEHTGEGIPSAASVVLPPEG